MEILLNINLNFGIFLYVLFSKCIYLTKLEVLTIVFFCNMFDFNSFIKFKILGIRDDCNYFYVNYGKFICYIVCKIYC